MQPLITKTITNQKHQRLFVVQVQFIQLSLFLHSSYSYSYSSKEMETLGKTFLTLLLLSSIFSIASSRKGSASSSNIDWWCNLTPHPVPCKHYIFTTQMKNHHNHNQNHHFTIKHKTNFRTMLVQLALNQALTMQKEARDSDQTNMATKNHRTVYGDCLRLFEKTIFHLNRTLECLHGKQNCSSEDAQTWLSTALTNIQTCQTCTVELGVDDYYIFKVPTNISDTADSKVSRLILVSEMIRNSLAINMDFMKLHHHTQEETEDVFPRWFSRHERKLLQSSSIKAHVVVAKDGSGNFRRVQDALDAAAKRKVKTRFVIRVKKGVYRENIEVAVDNDNIMLVGDGIRNTIITSGRSVNGGYTTYSSATAGIDGLHFIARDITFQNTAGPQKGQAVALRSASDLSVFYRCAIMGYQDTLMAHAQRQFYRQCYIYGTIDLIFGNAAVVFQNCYIYARRPLEGQANMITAQGRGDPFQNTGISIHNSQIRAAPDLRPVVDRYNTFLGRPWQQYARVVVMKTFIDTLVSPLGWSPWGDSDFAQDTLYYGEYKNYGPGASTTNRVKWPGFHVITSPAEASQFTVTRLLAGPTWLASTTVPFTSGL